jgi:hypothetical protein
MEMNYLLRYYFETNTWGISYEASNNAGVNDFYLDNGLITILRSSGNHSHIQTVNFTGVNAIEQIDISPYFEMKRINTFLITSTDSKPFNFKEVEFKSEDIPEVEGFDLKSSELNYTDISYNLQPMTINLLNTESPYIDITDDIVCSINDSSLLIDYSISSFGDNPFPNKLKLTNFIDHISLTNIPHTESTVIYSFLLNSKTSFHTYSAKVNLNLSQ